MMFEKSFKPVKKTKLSDQVIQVIQDKISIGELKPGDKLPNETELMAIFEVGRSTIRESIRVLAKLGLIVVRQGDGTYVLSNEREESLNIRISRATVLEVYQVRRLLELELARLAAQNRTEKDIAEMRFFLEKRRTASNNNDSVGYVKNDLGFHQAIAKASKNSIMIDLYRSFSNALKDALEKLRSDDEIYQDPIELHEKILLAIEQGDPENAVRFTQENLDKTMHDLKNVLDTNLTA